jgi:Tol biopolymer transport system component
MIKITKLIIGGIILILLACSSMEIERTPTLLPEILAPTPTLQDAAPQATSSKINGMLAFTSERDGNMEIYIMDTDGSEPVRLTDNPAEDYWPTWSPDGTQIAFTSDRDGDFEIYIINADGSHPQRLTQQAGNDLEPAWSPDGTQIAFMVHQKGKSDIYSMKPDGTGRQKLTESSGNNYLPKWSPDGTQIVFVSDRDGNPEIYIMDSDGNNQIRLSNNPTEDSYPSWSGEGTRITFFSERNGNKELYVIDSDGSNPTPLTDDNAAVWVSDWSPDGSKIAFTSNRDGNREIYIMDMDSGHLQRLTNNKALDDIPAWRPKLSATSAVSQGTDKVKRTALTYNDLMDSFAFRSPLDEAALTLPAEAAPPNNYFEGRLELHGEASAGQMNVLRGDPNQEPEVSHLPEFDFTFVQNEGYLIPVRRGLIITDHPYWNYILEPGRVWSEDGDHGYSRASFPFALVWKDSNATLNGTMSFLFDDAGISKVWYQITQETTISFSADLWGLLEGSYHAEPVIDSAEIKTSFVRELADRFPTKPIQQLEMDYPGVDASAFGYGVPIPNMTWYGFVVNGVNYVGGCQTRYGEYPYCEYMRAPSYSTAKSAFVSVALMRLAQKYDPNVPNLLIKDYVPEAADSPGDWSAVTFNHVLDMATGNYQSADMMKDEEQWDNPFWNENYYDPIITAAFNWPNSSDPGKQWVYRTSDTFILTRALQNYLVGFEGPGADIFEFVLDEVYKPLKIGPGAYTVLRTQDDHWQGQPYGGFGQWWIPDDLAKISSFLNVDQGAIDGIQILRPNLLAASLQRDPKDRGVDRGFNGKYNNAFWADGYKEGYECEFWVSQMLGYSGIVVALMPNETSYYYASDGRNFTWDAAVREANKILPYCP